MKTASVLTSTVHLYIAGDIDTAKQLLRRECYPPNEGLCVTVEPTTFIYTGGEEQGLVVGFVNYPRFPKTPDQLWRRAVSVAFKLMPALCQWTCLLVAIDRTEWFSLRPEDQ